MRTDIRCFCGLLGQGSEATHEHRGSNLAAPTVPGLPTNRSLLRAEPSLRGPASHHHRDTHRLVVAQGNGEVGGVVLRVVSPCRTGVADLIADRGFARG